MQENIIPFPMDKVKPTSYENMENNILPFMSKEQKLAEKIAFLESLKIEIIELIGKRIGRPVTPSEVSVIFKDKTITLFELNGLGTMNRAIKEQRLDLTEMFSSILSNVMHGTIVDEKGKVYVKSTGAAPVTPDILAPEPHPFLNNVSHMSDYRKPEMQQESNANIPMIDLDQKRTGTNG